MSDGLSTAEYMGYLCSLSDKTMWSELYDYKLVYNVWIGKKIELECKKMEKWFV